MDISYVERDLRRPPREEMLLYDKITLDCLANARVVAAENAVELENIY